MCPITKAYLPTLINVVYALEVGRCAQVLLRVPAWLTRPKSIFQWVLKSRPPISSVLSGPLIITPVISCHIAHLTHASYRISFFSPLFVFYNQPPIGRINLNSFFNRFETSRWKGEARLLLRLIIYIYIYRTVLSSFWRISNWSLHSCLILSFTRK